MSQLQVTGEAKIRDIQGPVVANSGVITALDGAASQYVRGDGTLADFPTSTGGGSSVSYYLNSSVSQGTIGGVAYRELSKDPIAGAGTDITISANGYVASYITDANDPALLEVPAGNFNCEFYFSVNSNNHNPYVYAEVYKYDGTTFTLIGSSQSVPEYLTNGTTLSPYYFAIPVTQTTLAITDRIAIRIYVNVDTKVVTLHTENNHLCQVVTTFSKGLTSLNNLTRQVQFLATGTSGTDFNISSSTATHTFNIPSASASNRGLITTGTQTIAGDKTLNGNTDFVGNSNFSGYAIFSNAIPTQINYGAKIAKGSIPATFGSDSVNLYSDATTNNIIFRDNLSIAKLLFNNSTQTFTFPAASGTIALTSNLSLYVPYTGATANVDLGIYGLAAAAISSTGQIAANGFLGALGGLVFAKGNIPSSFTLGDVILYAEASSNNIVFRDNTSKAKLLFNNSDQTYTFPAATGTLALTSNLSSYVPYTGATTNVDLGASNNLSANNITALGFLKSDFGLLLKSGLVSTVSGYLNISAQKISGNSQLNVYTDTGFSFSLSAPNNANYTYSFPSSSGTVALTSDLSAYLPLTGGTLTGALSGTSATFSTEVTSSGSQGRFGGWATGAGYQGAALEVGVSGGTATLLGYNRTSGAYIPLTIGGNTNQTTTIGGNTIVLQNNGTTALTIASTGAATFSNRVTANDFALTGTGAVFQATVSAGNNSQYGYFQNNGGVYYFGKDNIFGSEFGAGAYAAVLWNTGNNPIVFATANTQKMTITSGGNVGIGTSSPTNTGGYATLTIGGNSTTKGQLTFNSSTTPIGYLYNDATNMNIGSENALIFATTSAAVERMRITSAGNTQPGTDNAYSLGVSGTRWSAVWAANGTIQTSDEREKKDIIDADLGLDFISKLRPVSFKWKVGQNIVTSEVVKDEEGNPILDEEGNEKTESVIVPREGKRTHYGLIAQEVEELLDGKDFGGFIHDEETDTKGLRYDQFIPLLIKSIQELEAKIVTLESKLN
jgi:hypothetical protein